MDAEQAAALREPFPREQIGKLPRITCGDCRDSRNKVCEKHQKRKCPPGPEGCGNYMTTEHLHLDYVGHAAVTQRLLDVDQGWYWEPVARQPDTGMPMLAEGGLWIRLTVAGVTRYGYGDAQGKASGDAMKERIGDAIRNAAMRFGVALDLWSKEDLDAASPVNEADPATVEDIRNRIGALPPPFQGEAKTAYRQRFGKPDDLTAAQAPAALAMVVEYEQKARAAAEPAQAPDPSPAVREADDSEPREASEPQSSTEGTTEPSEGSTGPERSGIDWVTEARALGITQAEAIEVVRRVGESELHYAKADLPGSLQRITADYDAPLFAALATFAEQKQAAKDAKKAAKAGAA